MSIFMDTRLEFFRRIDEKNRAQVALPTSNHTRHEMTKSLTTRHPNRPSTYYINRIETIGAELPDGLSIEWTVSSYYCEDEKCTKWEDDCMLVNAPQSPTFYENIEDYQGADWMHERARVVDTIQDRLCCNGVYYRKADIVRAAGYSAVKVVCYKGHYEISLVPK